MKRRYTSIAYKRRQRYLNSYGDMIVVKKKRHKKYSAIIKGVKDITVDKKLKIEIIPAPKNFSMINNIDEMLGFFYNLYICIQENKYDIMLNMQPIESITPDAIIYLLSVLDYYESKNSFKHNLRGNFPNDKNCESILLESGFPDYINMSSKVEYTSANFIKIKKNDQVRSDIADKVISFAENKLNFLNKEITDSIYVTIVECMNNTRQHAFTNERKGNWWLIAFYDEKIEKVQFCLFDNGQGIPNSVKLTFSERFKELLPKTNNLHSELIMSTLNGDFRTQTKLSYRGKGLPKIKSYSDDKLIEDLVIISNKGYVNLQSNEIRELNYKFYGTLLSWNFIKY